MSVLSKIITIVGATCSGKSDLALALAHKMNGEVLSADSRTIYKEMNIGTAKPMQDTNTHTPLLQSIKDLFLEKPYFVQGIPHWGINLVSPNEPYDVATYAQYAKQKINDIVHREHVPFLVGGSGLYIQSIVDNPTFSEVAPNEKRRSELQSMTLQELQVHLQKIDPEAYEIIDIENPRRLVRTIEVIESTGLPWISQQKKGNPYVNALQIGIDIDRETLYERINTRVDFMIANGLIDEVRALKKKYGNDAPGMSGIGYRQLCAFFDGHISLKDAIEQMKRDTRHYAKRQETWFKRDKRIVWIKTHEEAMAFVEKFLQK